MSPNNKLKKWKLVESEKMVDSKWIKVFKNTYLLRGNKLVDDYYITRERDVALIAAVDDSENVLLTREYRPAINDFSIELPAGFIEDSDKTIESTAIREFSEETGFKFNKLEFLGKFYRSTGRTEDMVHFFLAFGLYKHNGLNLDFSETLKPFMVPFNDALEMIEKGEIVQQSSVMGLLLARDYLEKGKRKT